MPLPSSVPRLAGPSPSSSRPTVSAWSSTSVELPRTTSTALSDSVAAGASVSVPPSTVTLPAPTAAAMLLSPSDVSAPLPSAAPTVPPLSA